MAVEYYLISIFLLFIWAAVLYNRLVLDKNRVLQAWSDINVQLKRRHDLIPKLVDAVTTYADYERSTLDALTRLRTEAEHAGRPGKKSGLEQQLSGRLRELIAVAEAYPELKAGDQYLQLLRQLSEVGNHIQHARRYYNGSVRNLNVRIDSFPDLIIARLFGYRPVEFFELESSLERQPPEIG